MDLEQLLPARQRRLVVLAVEAGIPIIVAGDRTKATGKTTLCDWLREQGATAYEEWEVEEGIVQPDDDSGRNSVSITVRLNKPIFTF